MCGPSCKKCLKLKHKNHISMNNATDGKKLQTKIRSIFLPFKMSINIDMQLSMAIVPNHYSRESLDCLPLFKTYSYPRYLMSNMLLNSGLKLVLNLSLNAQLA